MSDALEYQPHTHEAEPGGHPDPEMLELTRLSGGDQVSIPRLKSFYLGSMNRGGALRLSEALMVNSTLFQPNMTIPLSIPQNVKRYSSRKGNP